MSEPMTLAYLTGIYARASDSFVRGEVRELRALGHTVHTFSIRRPAESELVTGEIRAEHDRTHYVVAAGPRTLLGSALRMALRRPLRMARAAVLAARIGWPGAKGRLWPFAYLVEAAYLAERLEELGVQHLHDHIAEGSAAVAMLASELTGIGWSFTVHGPGEFDRAATLALGEKVARARFVAAISDYARAQVLRWARPRDWPRVHVVRCGVDGAFLAGRAGGDPPGRRLVCVGRLDEQKGHPVLLRAAALVAAGGVDFELVLVGDGPLRGELEATVERLGLRDRVRLAGWASGDAVRDLMAGSRALVLASFAEGLPVVIMESLALGRPVIATDVGAVSELVVTGETGWLVAPGSEEALAE
ncbi:MAG: colanic acid/amylovoran biosynthesis glycosyltransferase, partial [Thermoleophilaceae bacterium]|nr:colanic acid/amylovoran biosynthesis glycosyltransferase [Thermoleophilaceae bacterium]